MEGGPRASLGPGFLEVNHEKILRTCQALLQLSKVSHVCECGPASKLPVQHQGQRCSVFTSLIGWLTQLATSRAFRS